MTPEADFSNDAEFTKLLARRQDIDLPVVMLELARDAYPDLDFAPTLDWLQARAGELSSPVARAKNDRALLEALASCLAGKHDLRGTADCFKQTQCSYLNRVIETRRGIPLSLSVVYMAVAARLGIELCGVAAPMHFITRYEGIHGPLFVDAFGRGRILTQEDCVAWLQEKTGQPAEQIEHSLGSASVRNIVVRALNNLKGLHIGQETWTRALRVQQRLAALEPANYHQRRDLALLSLRAGDAGRAVDLIDACLKTCPADERPLLEQHRDEAKRELSRWN